MKYFSGFSLQNEEVLFSQFLNDSEFCIAGFSYGAIKAFEYVLKSNERIDKLILISPAFFQDKTEKFSRLQLIHFNKDSKAYIENFLKNIAFPTQFDLSKYLKVGTFEELKELLTYEWKRENLEKVVNKNIKIEIYLGEKDKIIDSLKVKDFFVDFATIYYIKNVGHILK